MNRTTVVLSVVLLALVAVVVLVERPWSDGKQGYVERKPLFEDFEADRVSYIRLLRGNDELELRRAQDGWVVQTHGDYPANVAQIQQIVAAVQQWKIEARVGSADRSEQYMLDESQGTRVTLKDADDTILADLYTGRVAGFNAKEAERMGGKVDTEDFGIYVRRADAPDVYFMKGLFLGTFSPDPSTFIDRSIFSFPPEHVREWSSSCGDSTLAIHRSDEEWAMDGLDLPPDREAIAQVVESFAHLSAVTLAGPGQDYGLQPPACVVRATLEDGTQHVLEVGGKAEEDRGFYARPAGSSFVLVISRWEVESWQKQPNDYARKRLWTTKQPDLQSIRVTRDGESVRLRKVERNQWVIETEEVGDVAADAGAAWKLVNAISNTEVKEYVTQNPAPAHGLTPPRLTATAETADGDTLTLHLGGDHDTDEVYAATESSPWVVLLPRKVLEDLTVDAAELKRRARE